MPSRSRSNEIVLYEPPETLAQVQADIDHARYFSGFVDKRSIAPLRPSYAFPRLYTGLFQALFEKLRSVRNVDLVNEMDEIMINMTIERENKLRITASAVEASIENLLSACLICLSSSQDLYLDLSEVSCPTDDIIRSLETLLELSFDVELHTLRCAVAIADMHWPSFYRRFTRCSPEMNLGKLYRELKDDSGGDQCREHNSEHTCFLQWGALPPIAIAVLPTAETAIAHRRLIADAARAP